MGHTKPESILLRAAAAAPAYGTPKEIVTLEVEDMPVEIYGEGLVCTTCYEIIPKDRNVSHQSDRSCHLPARPPEAVQDKFSCNTCHWRFKSEEANDLHEPCKPANNNSFEQKGRQKQKRLTLAIWHLKSDNAMYKFRREQLT